MWVQVVVQCDFWKIFYSCTVQKKKTAIKLIFQKISGYTTVNLSEEDLHLVK